MQDTNLWANWAQIISVPIAIIALLVSVWLYRRSRQRRDLTCVFDPIVSPLEIKAGKAIEGDIEIRYKGQAVKNLFLVRATLKNTGNMAIRQSHIVEPITFTFGLNTVLMRPPQFLERIPKNLEIDWSFLPQPTRYVTKDIAFTFDLFNPGEEFAVEFLCTGETTLPKLSARIEGISEIGIRDPEGMSLRKDAIGSLAPIAALLLFLLSFVWYVILPPLKDAGTPTLMEVAVTMAVGASVVFVLQILTGFIAKWVRYRRRERR